MCHISVPQQLRFFHKGGLLEQVTSKHGLVKLSSGIWKGNFNLVKKQDWNLTQWKWRATCFIRRTSRGQNCSQWTNSAAANSVVFFKKSLQTVALAFRRLRIWARRRRYGSWRGTSARKCAHDGLGRGGTETDPIVFDVFNLCDMHGWGKLWQLSVAMLLSICEHIDIDLGNIKGQRKAAYLPLLGEFRKSCFCHHSPSLWLAAIISVTYWPGSTIYL